MAQGRYKERKNDVDAIQYRNADRSVVRAWCESHHVLYTDGLGQGPVFCVKDMCQRGWVVLEELDWLTSPVDGACAVLSPTEFSCAYEKV